MIKRSTWILLAILMLATGAYFYLKHRPVKSAEATPTAPATSYLFTESDGPLASIRIYGRQANDIMLERNPSGVWTLVLPTPAPADQAQAGAAETQLGALEIVDVLQTLPALDTLGLTSPAHTIKVSFQNGIQHLLEVGDLAPTGSGYYVRFDNGKIYIISTSGIDALLNLLNNPPYVATETPTPTLVPTSIPEMATSTSEAVTPTPTP
jgi:hypothetical protein